MTSKVIGFKASRSADRDILAWWESMPTGDRSGILCDLIRVHLQRGSPTNGDLLLADIGADVSQMRQELAAVHQLLRQLSSRGFTPPTNGSEPETATGQAQLSQDDARRRLANMMNKKW